jgi:5-formyltetrahydrofolate cyclo-ligase
VEERHSHQGQSGFTATAVSRSAAPRHHRFVPTPRLRGGFKKLDPCRIPPDKIEAAASLSRGDRWSEEVALADMPGLDAIVCGSVAVTRDGRRCGKGEGYSDLEFAILRELGTRRCLSPRPCTICRSSTPCPATQPISRSV